jgi:hypothetical protein
MSLSELTDPRAVYKVIEEFDRLGRNETTFYFQRKIN